MCVISIIAFARKTAKTTITVFASLIVCAFSIKHDNATKLSTMCRNVGNTTSVNVTSTRSHVSLKCIEFCGRNRNELLTFT